MAGFEIRIGRKRMTKDLERFTPDLGGQIAYEHRHRYALCEKFVAEKDVLDVACGEGYGAAMLARRARRVIGVDIDAATISAAAEKYGSNERLEFKVADCASLPFAKGGFDVVVSFETIEHIAEQEAFVKEAARVLKKNGVFIVSTPNRPVYSGETGLNNPFHVKELDEDEFRSLLEGAFKHVQLLGQRFVIPSMIAQVNGRRDSNQRVVNSLVARKNAAARPISGVAALEHAQYFVAVCSNAALRRKLETPSIFIDETEDLWREHQKVLRWASGLHAEDEILRTRLQQSERRLEEINNQAQRGTAEKIEPPERPAHEQAEYAGEIERTRAQSAELRARLDEAESALRSSTARATQLRHELVAAQAALQSAEKREQEAARALADAQRNIAQSQTLNARLAEDAAAARREQKGFEREIAKLATALEEARAGRQRAENRAAATADSFAAAEKVIETLRDDMAKQRDAFEEEKQGHAREMSQLRDDIAHRERAALDFTAEIEDRDAELERKSALLEKYAAAAAMQRRASERLDRQIRVIGIKRAIETKLAAAAQTVRMRLSQAPLGIVAHRGRLASALARPEAPAALGRSERREIEKSGLFDPQWYLAQNPDVAQHQIEPLAHYLRNGFREDRDPHPLFNSAWYRALYAAELGGMAPLIHYLRNGKSARRSPHPLFDPRFYLQKNPDVAAHKLDPLSHYIDFGEQEHRDPHPLIWVERLLRQPGFDDVERPLTAYLNEPRLFLASPHPLFDAEFYLHENNDVRRQGMCPLLHYCAIGWRDGRQPHRVFSGDWYLAQNPDVLSAQINPLEHFVRYGAFEQRAPHPLFDLAFYLQRNRDARAATYDALSHYVLDGARERRETTETISVADMQSIVPDAYWRRFDPISAFIYFGETRIAVPTQARDFDAARPLAVSWPPQPAFTYWLPQQLRDYIVERYGEDHIGLYIYLMSVVDRYGDQSEAFAQSPEFADLKDRLGKFCSRRHPRRRGVDVSIIIPVYNNLVFTLTCVISVLENKSRYAYEIIIGDDRSSDETAEVFSMAGGPIAHVRQEKNLGFLGNCNVAAKVAKGRYLVFLNNDTLTLPNWLDELIDVFEKSDRIGLSGSKLINADGTLQEAGGIFWRDGSAWNFGRNSDPRLPEFNYLKDVDYISGASIALPAKVWNALGGFDPIFTPAYCEDSDLAFRVREAGLRTVYVPHSELVHHEGKSHGRDTSSGVKAYQIANQEKLFTRWRSALEGGHFVNGENVFLARDRSRGRPHVLVVDHYIPQWDRDAGSRTMHHFLRMFLAAGFQVTFWPDNLNEDREYCATLQKAGIEVIYSAAYLDRFDEFMAASGQYFDYALLSRPHIALKYYDAIRAHSRCRILYYGHDIHHKRMELELKTSENPELVEAIEDARAQELDNWRKADVVLYPSADERDEVRRVLHGCAAENVPMLGYLREELAVAHANLARFDARNFDELLFVGGSHPPNVDALLWFSKEVMPLILARRPSARLNVVGSTSSPDIARLESDAIVIRGRLSDGELADLYATVGVAVIPLRFGGGVKGKTIEAMFNAIPFVATSVGMQGLFTAEPIGYVADEADALAEAVLKAQSDRAGARANVERGIAFIEQNYSIDALRRAFAPFAPECAVAAAQEVATTALAPEPARAVEALASGNESGQPAHSCRT